MDIGFQGCSFLRDEPFVSRHFDSVIYCFGPVWDEIAAIPVPGIRVAIDCVAFHRWRRFAFQCVSSPRYCGRHF